MSRSSVRRGFTSSTDLLFGANLFSVFLLLALATSSVLQADIIRWDTRQEIPGTEGISPEPGVQLNGRSLEFASLSNIDLTGANLIQSNLADALFHSATLADANLSQANLTGASFDGATLTDAKSRHANLASASFEEATLTGADLAGATLSSSNFDRANLSAADLRGAVNFAGADLDDARHLIWPSFFYVTTAH